jgi:GntR family transcriptional regulator
VINFRLNPRSGVSPYQQLVQQVRQALRLGVLVPGDQLPTVKEVAAAVAINPNTVLKAYRELEHEGLVAGRPGQGTFVLKSLDGPPPGTQQSLRRALDRWLRDAFAAGLDVDSVIALFETSLQSSRDEGAA